MSRRKRGISAVQTAVVLALLAAGLFLGVRSLGTNTSSELDQTASEIGDPSSLVDRFGN
ncbi:MAG: hypothetical protein R3E01_35695 [Pirellulaceae bacterium]|nr:hypothetical protein [Planctomycetales bacterium]